VISLILILSELKFVKPLPMMLLYKKSFFQGIFTALLFLGCNTVLSQTLRADGTLVNSTIHDPGQADKTNKIMNTVVCPPVAGITCTLNGPNSSTYLGAPAGCNAGAFAGSNPWDGGSSTGFVSWAFSAPIKGVTLKAGSVNTNDFATMSFSGGIGGTISISGLVCLSSLVGMTIGAFTGVCCGDVSWNVNSTGTFTFVNLLNTGGQSGWIGECPSFITVLPIELLSFDGTCVQQNTIQLNWKTITESNNAYFAVERSLDALDWKEVGRVNGAGNSNTILEYNFTDTHPDRAVNYYRLRQTDLNGQFEYSPVRSVENCNISNEVNVFPNPAESAVTVVAVAGSVLEVTDVIGLKVASFTLSSGENKIDVSGLKSGTYFFNVINPDSGTKVHKIVISKN
jgi:hypothetical protein